MDLTVVGAAGDGVNEEGVAPPGVVTPVPAVLQNSRGRR